MFHLAKVIEVVNWDEKGAKFSEATTHALLEMWDDNILLFKVASNISKEIKPNDFVLVDYSPIAVGGAPVPKHEVVAVLSEAKGKKLWTKMRDYLTKKRNPDGSDNQLQTRDNHAGKMVG